MTLDPTKLSLIQIKREAIKRLLKPERLKEKGAWPRELAILNKLYPSYPDPAFWIQASIIDFEGLNSLAWLLSGRGAECLAAAWAVYRFEYPSSPETPPAPATPVDTTPPTPYHVSPSRPVTTAEFLSSGS